MSFVRYKDIKKTRIQESDYLKTGITKLDKKMLGLGKGQLVIITGTRGGGKTSLLGQIKLNFIDNGYKGVEFNLEMKNDRAKQWVLLQACGKDNLLPRQTSTGKIVYEPKNEYIEEKIENWISDKCLIDDNSNYNADIIVGNLEKFISEHQIDFVIIDNLFRMDIAKFGNEKYQAQTSLIKKLQKLCQEKNICLILVCHPTKVKTCPRIEDVSGSGDLVNACDTCLIVHRITNDFKFRAKETFGWNEDGSVYKDLSGNEHSTFIEIAKDREFGNEGTFIGLFFEDASKRFLNEIGEYRHYGWEENLKTERLDLHDIF